MNKTFELYEEYCQSKRHEPNKQTLRNNLLNFQKEYRQHLLGMGKNYMEYRDKAYERQLAKLATERCKSKKEWQDMEADDQRMMATGVMTYKSAQELLERYIDKINLSYKAEQWFMNQIVICDDKLKQISCADIPARKKRNKLNHWQARKTGYVLQLSLQAYKTNRLEALVTKWRGICEKIKTADIAREIAAERAGNGNKYGFNPNMQSRDTATGIFED